MFSPAYYRERLNQLPQIAVDVADYRILTSTRDFKNRLLELIKSARKRIYLTALYLEADAAGEDILRALFEAKQNNPALDIKVFVDFHRAQRGRIGEEASLTNRDFYHRLTNEYEHKIEIYGVPVNRREIFGVLHLKGFVFDNTVLYSGASLNDVYLHQDERYRYDRYHEIKSPELSNSFVEFIDHYFCSHSAVQALDGESVPTRKELKQEFRRFRKSMRKANYRFTPVLKEHSVGLTPVCGMGSRGNALNSMIRDLVRSAENELFICTPYFNPPGVLARDIGQLLKRGVKITIVVGDKTANDFYIPPEESFSKIGGLPYLYESNLREFARKHQKAIDSGQLNLMLWKDSTNSYHLKGLYVDGKRAMITGSNLNPRAWGLDLENGILVQDEQGLLHDQLIAEQTEILCCTTKISNYQELEQLSDYPGEVQKLLNRIHRLKAHVLIKKII
ncbi:CDP-diacylglycerol--serine O-phosphatidyltransferase [Parendozoicomonas haliclonae]|uniref:CDP-diacylglycerol-serine O-phosphatidyltransferase n=1 Tax=Parendozoicomonas haliclonae TaxID=1960125 RepID=A0A1X7AEE2_9GAMM|nr:CDP-diacylglycerol--serine O-phosphatidyltransferase [Parendozoicomonas haliclonae]SMA32791.1 CDP-diacylglycerol-serine O-phosphatidyltransferase [Parendozoicomonas haliclonae]